MFMSSRALRHAPLICTSCRFQAIIRAKEFTRTRNTAAYNPYVRQQREASKTYLNQTATSRQDAVTTPDEGVKPVVSEEEPLGLSPEQAAFKARQLFGNELPKDALDADAYRVYERLYGRPVRTVEPDTEESVMGHEEANDAIEQSAGTGLLRETEDGSLVELEVEMEKDEENEVLEDTEGQVQDRHNDIARLEEREEEGPSFQRTHPLTLANRFATSPSTLPVPSSTVTQSMEELLASTNNSHISSAAHNIFGGVGLPHSTSTPAIARTNRVQQKAIPLTAAQPSMRPMEGDVFMAVLFPGIYAAVMSVLVETRKRLGSAWAEKLVRKAERGELRVLDAGGGGAGIVAVREVIKSEWERLHEESTDAGSGMALAEADGKIGGMAFSPPTGHATVLVASDILRHRAAKLLENTTFIPRLPDYVHAENMKVAGKFDLIIAPHTLWGLREDYLRKLHVENLWTLLKRDGDEVGEGGGVLILLEKGVPRGFETIADARETLLESYITQPEIQWQISDQAIEEPPTSELKDKGMIIAPCTNHQACPMYHPKGVVKGRRDYCHFAQRYTRPAVLQQILGARDKNFEDVEFAYLSVMRGREMASPNQEDDSLSRPRQDEQVTDLAFAGFEHSREPSAVPSLSLPRAVLPPLKRTGHVILDLCTPAGTLERWTVPKSFSSQAFHDARKSSWGDLWALGAKTRVPRVAKIKKRKTDDEMGPRVVGGRKVLDYDEFGRVVLTAAKESAKEKRTRKKRERRERRDAREGGSEMVVESEEWRE